MFSISLINLGQRWIAVGIAVHRKKIFVEQELSGGSTEQGEAALVILGWLFWGELGRTCSGISVLECLCHNSSL